MWLIEKSELDRIEKTMSVVKVDADTIDAIAARVNSDAPAASISDGVASIDVRGVLTKRKSPMLAWYGIENTAYDDITSQIQAAVSSGAKQITLNVDSGGGSVDGLYSAMDALAGATIPTVAIVDGMAASAAYMLASQAGSIVARNDLSMIGSVGVVTTIPLSTWSKEITNRDSKAKRPDVTTPDGVGQVEDELDDIYSVLVEKIAAGRNANVDTVSRDYGRGAMMTARTAIKKGMIDAIGIEKKSTNAGDTANTNQGVVAMDKDQMRKEHPELFAAVRMEGVEAAKAECLEIVQGHLALADASGDMDRALADIKALAPITSAVMAHHTAAGIRAAQVTARKEEAPPVIDAASTAGVPAEKEKWADEKAALAAAFEGVEMEWN